MNPASKGFIMDALVGDKDRHQWFTPAWAGRILFEEHFSHLGAGDLVVEPTCGIGTFLSTIPAHVDAVGVEVDPVLADIARRSTGRRVIGANFLDVDFGDERPCAFVGNPPFELDVIDAIFDRCHELLPYGGKVGFIMPAYAFQTASRVVTYARKWSLEQEMIPRNLFKGMQKPLCFAVLTKDSAGHMKGFSLYRELHDVNSMDGWVVRELSTGRSPWKQAVSHAIEQLGGEASLEQIYAIVGPRRPTGNPWWKEKIRQTLRRPGAFVRTARSTYGLVKDTNKLAA